MMMFFYLKARSYLSARRQHGVPGVLRTNCGLAMRVNADGASPLTWTRLSVAPCPTRCPISRPNAWQAGTNPRAACLVSFDLDWLVHSSTLAPVVLGSIPLSWKLSRVF